MSHPNNIAIAENQEDKAREELTNILDREPTADEVLAFILNK